MQSFDPADLDPRAQYRLLAGAVVPRPIALVVTTGPHGPNAAPFSFFNMVAVDPPMLMFSAAPRAGEGKDTIRNIRDNGEFVVHIVGEAEAERMNACAASLPADTSEIDLAGFATTPSVTVAPPRLPECPVQLECRAVQLVDLGRRPHTAVIGEVLRMHFREGVLAPDRTIDGGQLGAIGRISGQGAYARLTDVFHLRQPE